MSDSQARESRRQLSILWARHHHSISAFIHSIIRDHHLAEDVLQDTAATVAERFDEFDQQRPFLPWVMTIARSRSLDLLRSISRDRLVFSDELVLQLCDTYCEREYSTSDTLVALEKCVERVPPRSRKLLELRYLRDMDAAAIAGCTGMTPGTVGVALHRVRKALAECISRVSHVQGIGGALPQQAT